jgi:predicted DNA-binding transcriptional regulator AlpA
MPQESPVPSTGPAHAAVSPPPAGLQTPALLNTREVARLLRVDASSVRRWRAEQPPQGPPFIRLSERVVLYDAADVREWLNEHRSAQARQGKVT